VPSLDGHVDALLRLKGVDYAADLEKARDWMLEAAAILIGSSRIPSQLAFC
jgi:hypothetical protein